MNHQKKGRKFGRKRGPRQAFIKGLAGNLIMRERISTTETRAKAIRPVVEKLVTVARRGTLADLRLLFRRLDKASAEKLYYEIAPRYKERPGGYLRINKTSNRRQRDAAPVATIEFV